MPPVAASHDLRVGPPYLWIISRVAAQPVEGVRARIAVMGQSARFLKGYRCLYIVFGCCHFRHVPCKCARTERHTFNTGRRAFDADAMACLIDWDAARKKACFSASRTPGGGQCRKVCSQPTFSSMRAVSTSLALSKRRFLPIRRCRRTRSRSRIHRINRLERKMPLPRRANLEVAPIDPGCEVLNSSSRKTSGSLKRVHT
jgi:hypothetical protein